MTRCILAGVDHSEQSTQAFRFALELARLSAGQLHVCAAVHDADIELADPEDRSLLIDKARRRMRAVLDHKQTLAAEHGIKLTTHLLDGHPVEALLALASQINADHIVVGHRSKGLFERLLMGSVAKRVVDFARCSVTVVR